MKWPEAQLVFLWSGIVVWHGPEPFGTIVDTLFPHEEEQEMDEGPWFVVH